MLHRPKPQNGQIRKYHLRMLAVMRSSCLGMCFTMIACGGKVISVANGPQEPRCVTATSITSNCALAVDGSTWCWGDNRHGEIGDGTTEARTSPVEISALGRASGLATSFTHGCALKPNKELWCWGDNAYPGFVGDGTTQNIRPVPVQLTVLGTTVVDVAVGTTGSCARVLDATWWCWWSSIGVTSRLDSPTPVQVVTLGTDTSTIAIGENHRCARKTDGSVWCWGQNGSGAVAPDSMQGQVQLPVEITAVGRSIREVSVGAGSTCAVKLDGSLWCWGGGFLGDGAVHVHDLIRVPLTGVSQISSGFDQTCVLNGGDVWCWGLNEYGQLGDGSTEAKLSPVKVMGDVDQVVAGFRTTCARTKDKSLWCWGNNTHGETGDGTSAGMSCNNGMSVCRLRPARVKGLCR